MVKCVAHLQNVMFSIAPVKLIAVVVPVVRALAVLPGEVLARKTLVANHDLCMRRILNSTSGMLAQLPRSFQPVIKSFQIRALLHLPPWLPSRRAHSI